MHMLLFLGKIKAAVETVQGYNHFVTDELAPILELFGDIHSRAAQGALSDAGLSEQPEREVASAITLLRPAYDSYLEAAQRKRFFGRRVYVDTRVELYRKATQVALLCAVAYSRLSEARLFERYVERAHQAFQLYEESSLESARENGSMRNDNYNSIFLAMLTSFWPGEGVEKAKERLAQERSEFQLGTAMINKFISA